MTRQFYIWTASLTLTVLTACESAKKIYCGYELSQSEYADLRYRSQAQGSAYEADSLWKIYDQINDSIRSIMPDTFAFEIFLSLLNENEVGIDVFIPKNADYFERIGCVIMNANFLGKLPSQRYLCLYTYTNPDGSGDIPFEFAIKREK